MAAADRSTSPAAPQPTVSRSPLGPDAVQVPVVIVGGGACGLTAALALHRLGVTSVVLERDEAPSGSTALSSGFIPAAGTQAQARQGIEDAPEAFAQDIRAKSKGQSDPTLVQAYTEAIAPALDALETHHGIAWQVLDDFLYPGHRVHRMHAVAEKTGAALMQRLLRASDEAGVAVLTQARVTTLHVDASERILGVSYLRPDGALEQVACDALILACNGFGGNPERVQQFLPEMAQAMYAGHVGNDGSALAWAEALGAQLADMQAYQGHGSWAVPQGALISWALMMEGGVQINARGARFHDETQGYSEAAMAVLAQPGAMAWNVFDAPLLRLAEGFPDFVGAREAGAVQTCADVQALARVLGCEIAALQATLDAVRAGTDAQTGRVFKRSLQWPLHAVRVTGALFHTQGGLAVDAHCRVLRTDGRPFANLLAAGGAARGVSGNAVWGYLSGNGLLSAVAGGHIAAHTAAQQMVSQELS